MSATTAGILFGVAADKMFYESYGVGGWLVWGALLAAAMASPLLCANALMSGRALPTFLELLGPREVRSKSVLTIILGLVLTVTVLIGAESALGFAFDPRYRDFPFAALAMAVVPFSMLALLNRPQQGLRPMSETVFAVVLAGAALYTLFNEGAENWQSLWSCALYLTLALTLWQARAVQIPE
jgi:glucan 1,3-beta-glucosidase